MSNDFFGRSPPTRGIVPLLLFHLITNPQNARFTDPNQPNSQMHQLWRVLGQVLTISFGIYRQIVYPENVKNSLLPASPTAIGSIRDLRWVEIAKVKRFEGTTLKFTKVLQVPNNQDVPPGHLDAVPQFRGDLFFFPDPVFFKPYTMQTTILLEFCI